MPSSFADIHPVITQCSISELYATKDQASIAMAKTCERRRCGHIPDPLPNHQCLTSCVNISGENKHRYVLATQDDALRVEMRLVPGVPMVYIRRAVMIMEPPSPATLTKREVLEREKLGGGGNPGKRKRDGDGDGVEESGKKKKKRGPKEPNPLSVKKKKKESKYGGTHSESDHGKTNNPGDENDKRAEIEGNVIGKVTESVRRLKSTRKRKHHKRAFMSKEQLIPEK